MCYNNTTREEQIMGTVHAEIILKNAFDAENAQRGNIKEEEVRAATVTAVVDTGAMSLFITEELRRELGLAVRGEKTVTTASGQQVICQVTDAVQIIWKDRDWAQPTLVIPGGNHVLLGAIALEGLDLMVNPVSQELVGVHGDKVEYTCF
jgi:clan AA aspartic protease